MSLKALVIAAAAVAVIVVGLLIGGGESRPPPVGAGALPESAPRQPSTGAFAARQDSEPDLLEVARHTARQSDDGPLAPEYEELWKLYPQSTILPPRNAAERQAREAREQELSYLHELIRNGQATRDDVNRYHDGKIDALVQGKQMLRDRLSGKRGPLLDDEKASIRSLIQAHDERIAQYNERRAKALAGVR